MKNNILFSLLISFFSINAFAVSSGDVAPEFELPGQSGITKLSDFKGKVIYLDFWASWCAPCRQSFPWMNEMQVKHGDKDFQIVAINLDMKPDDAQKFLAKQFVSFALAFDAKGQTPQKYGVKGMPSSFLIGRDGIVLARHMGFKEASRAELEQQMELALKDNKP
jgi:cytochrome c biogenesis protein CcmG/thiol:disulfide interchange protein DsbE